MLCIGQNLIVRLPLLWSNIVRFRIWRTYRIENNGKILVCNSCLSIVWALASFPCPPYRSLAVSPLSSWTRGESQLGLASEVNKHQGTNRTMLKKPRMRIFHVNLHPVSENFGGYDFNCIPYLLGNFCTKKFAFVMRRQQHNYFPDVPLQKAPVGNPFAGSGCRPATRLAGSVANP